MKSQEEIRKELEKIRNEASLRDAKKMALERELAQLETPAQVLTEENDTDKKQETTFCLSPDVLLLIKNNVKQEDMDQLLADYDARPNAIARTSNELTFATIDDALAFFQEQADKGRSFCVREKGSDFFIYSDGKGTLFKGTQAQLKEHLEQSSQLTMEDVPTSGPGI